MFSSYKSFKENQSSSLGWLTFIVRRHSAIKISGSPSQTVYQPRFLKHTSLLPYSLHLSTRPTLRNEFLSFYFQQPMIFGNQPATQ